MRAPVEGRGRGLVVVTGGAGRLGGYVVRELADGYRVRVADLDPREVAGAAESVACDVLDPAQLRDSLRGADAVCHLAGLDYDVEAAPAEYIRVNVLGTWNLLEAAAELGIGKVVLASSVCSSGLLDLAPQWVPGYLPVDESHPQRPYLAYSTSKKAVEELGRTWARAAGLATVSLQPLHVVFREALDAYLSFVRAADRRWLHNYVVAEDAARAFRQALVADVGDGESYLIGAADSPLAAATLDWYSARLGAPPRWDRGWFAGSPRASLFSTAKAARELDWAPRLTLGDLGVWPLGD